MSARAGQVTGALTGVGVVAALVAMLAVRLPWRWAGDQDHGFASVIDVPHLGALACGAAFACGAGVAVIAVARFARTRELPGVQGAILAGFALAGAGLWCAGSLALALGPVERDETVVLLRTACVLAVLAYPWAAGLAWSCGRVVRTWPLVAR